MISPELEHVLIAFIAALPATIAAISSVRNGREQKRVRRELEKVNGLSPKVGAKNAPKKGRNRPGAANPSPDWYQPPNFDDDD